MILLSSFSRDTWTDLIAYYSRELPIFRRSHNCCAAGEAKTRQDIMTASDHVRVTSCWGERVAKLALDSFAPELRVLYLGLLRMLLPPCGPIIITHSTLFPTPTCVLVKQRDSIIHCCERRATTLAQSVSNRPNRQL